MGVKRQLVLLTALAIAGLLMPFDPDTAHACSCDDSTLKELASHADVVVVSTVSDVRFIGPVEEIAATLRYPNGTSTENIKAEIVVDPDLHLKGDGGDSLVVRHAGPVHMIKDAQGQLSVWIKGGANCQLFDTQVGEPIGYRYLLFLRQLEEGAYSKSTCSGSRALSPHPDPQGSAEYSSYWDRRYAEYDDALGLPPGTLIAIANNAPPPAEPKDADFAYLPAAVAATLGPLAFLAGATFLWRWGTPHYG